MYGLENILIEQGVTLEQRHAILKLFEAAKCFDVFRFVLSLREAGFSTDESDRILAHTLNALYLQGDHFNPQYLLTALATEETHLKEKTRCWFDTMAKKVFIEQHELIQLHMTPAILRAFAPQPPEPAHKSYDTVIVLDGAEQPIMDGLAYLKHLLDTGQIIAGKILAPAELTPQNSSCGTSHAEISLYSSLPAYLKQRDLQARATPDRRLSRQTLGNFLVNIYSNQPDTTAIPALYQAIVAISRTNRTLIITTENDAVKDQATVAMVYEALPNCQIKTEVIYTLKKNDFTASDLTHLLIERFCQEPTPRLLSTDTSNHTPAAAAARTTTERGYTQTQLPALPSDALASAALPVAAAAAVPAEPSNRTGLFAVGLFAAGALAAANPQTTTVVVEAAKELAMTAVRSVFK